ncbi:unnamed protein product [Allacma fusca]|uniref:LITAF domain-containing protein n=1 Tax=Allacma fusca TaxID=39272 RepID=A0A8J2NV02_9HEXA|nr:unnamed protein product [Allacma fusca]
MGQEPTAPPMGVNTVAPQVTVAFPMSFQSEPQQLTCPHCQSSITTETKYHDGRMTHIAALVLCLLGCYCCCCIPYCIDTCKDADHECPSCHRHIGTFTR